MQKAVLSVQSADDQDSARREFIARMRETAAGYFSGGDEEQVVEKIVEETDAMLRAGDERLPEVASERLAAVFHRIYQDPEKAETFHQRIRGIERGFREQNAEKIVREGGVALSPERMLFGKLNEGGEGEEIFRLHVAEAKTLEPMEQIVDFRKGMRELARLAQNDPKYAGLKQVVGTSWLVGETVRLAKMMGFTVVDETLSPESAAHFGGETRKVQRCGMSRETLIARYGEKKSP